MPGGQDRRPEFVQSLARGLAVIKAFSAEEPTLTLSDVARHTGLTRASARRILLTLIELGYVASDGRRFSLRPRVLELGYAYLSALRLPDVALPHIKVLAGRVRESASVSVLDGTDVVYVARVPNNRIMSINIHVGTRLPAALTSMGRAMLAGLPPREAEAVIAASDLAPRTARTVTDPDRLAEVLGEVRSLGYALVDQELEEGLRSMAVPIHDHSGATIAAVNCSVHASRVTTSRLREEFLPRLRECAEAIESDLAGVPAVAELPPEA